MQEKFWGFKYCPICGSHAFRPKGDRAYECEACHLIYYINNSAAVACLIFNAEGEILLTRRAFPPNQGMLDLPGGFVDPLESVEEAVVREIKEELNLNIVSLKYLVSFPNLYPFSGLVIPTADLAFACEVADFTNLVPGDDVSSVEFARPENVDLSMLCSESMRQIISYYISNSRNSQVFNNEHF